jgi:hypothetical protein
MKPEMLRPEPSPAPPIKSESGEESWARLQEHANAPVPVRAAGLTDLGIFQTLAA